MKFNQDFYTIMKGHRDYFVTEGLFGIAP